MEARNRNIMDHRSETYKIKRRKKLIGKLRYSSYIFLKLIKEEENQDQQNVYYFEVVSKLLI